MSWLETLEDIQTPLVYICVLLMETIGIIVLVDTAVRCFIRWVRKDPYTQLDLAQGITTALTFKMAGEVLRTVIVRDWHEVGFLGAIILLRAAMAFILHWEIKSEKKHIAEESQIQEGSASPSPAVPADSLSSPSVSDPLPSSVPTPVETVPAPTETADPTPTPATPPARPSGPADLPRNILKS